MISKYLLRKNVIKRELKEFEMYLDLKTPGISKTLSIYRSREDDMIDIIKTYLKKGMTVVDCGSNIGFYPLLSSNILQSSGKIFAVEPDPRNFKMLLKNIQLSKYPE